MQTLLEIGLVLLLLAVEVVQAQPDPFTTTIDCYRCLGPLRNSTCGDPFDAEKLHLGEEESGIQIIKCKRGACLKWTYFHKGELLIRRTCSLDEEDLVFHIPLVDVCRRERDGNGRLCMCSGDLCNAARQTSASASWSLLIALGSVILSAKLLLLS
ncbi:protein quiver [Lingula anatina]|uniref:Protein quiver n=1 Tax=Lingula anatina TaxID=7574 RepID=A0A1S3IAK8_LINAN|nr:protein quiver [Lingula anatina]|eukprot:XP_013395300.1 protein quiver [Lingula anatina]